MNTRFSSGTLVRLTWLFATSGGWALGFALTWGIAPWFSWGTAYWFFFMLVFLFIAGLFIGIGQWVILRAKLSRVWAWIPVSWISLPIGFYTSNIGFAWIALGFGNHLEGVTRYVFYVASGFTAGLILGALQWLSLRRGIGGMLRWILVSALSWGIGIALPSFMLKASVMQGYYSDWTLVLVAGFLLIGLLVGAINAAFVNSCVLSTTAPERQRGP